MNLPYIDHLAILVEDLESSLNLYQEQFGFYLKEIKVMPDVGIKMAYLEAQNVGIELIQYLQPNHTDSAQLLAQNVMGSQMGYNHIAIRVESVDTEVKNRKTAGLMPHDGFPRQGLHGKVCFFVPETTSDNLIEICEEPKSS